MDEDTIEISPGKLGCPKCEIPLVKGKTPYFYEGRNIGQFDGIVCEKCGYGLLTEKGYDDSDKIIEWIESYLPQYAANKEQTPLMYARIITGSITANVSQYHTNKENSGMISGNDGAKIVPQIMSSRSVLKIR